MSRPLDPMQQSIVGDLHRILAMSERLHAYFMALPSGERENVEDHYLELAWQITLASANPLPDYSQDDAGKYYRAFGGFVLSCQQGKPARFMTSDWVAMDRKQFDNLTKEINQ